MGNELFSNLHRVHAKEQTAARIKKRLAPGADDAVAWCRQQIQDPETISRTEKSWRVRGNGFLLVIDALSYEILAVRRERPKAGSRMEDVGIIQTLDDLPALKQELIRAFEQKTHRRVSNYGLWLIGSTMETVGLQRNEAIEHASRIVRLWQEGEAAFQEARNAAGVILTLARAETDPVLEKALRAIAQAALIPHVKRHALIASDYAVKLCNTLYPGDLEAVKASREAQIRAMESV